MTQWDQTCDLAIVGSGGGSMCAALLAKEMGKRALIIEKQGKVGGSTGFSGGVMWIPNNPLMMREGVTDSYERARQYFDAVVAYDAPCTSPARREAFLRTGPKMVEFLEAKGMKFERADGWSDYYDDLPGGEPRGRSLVAPLFDLHRLGVWEHKLSVYKGFPLPAGSHEFPALFLVRRHWAGKKKALQLAGRLFYQKLTRKKLVGSGAAIQGRMLQIALREGIEFMTDTPVLDFVVEHGRVTGVVARRNASGETVRIRALSGVLINSGGFAHNAAMRAQYHPQPSSTDWTNANPGDTGEIIEAAMKLGAATDCMDEAWWVITSLGPHGELPFGGTAPDGTRLPFMHHLDLSLPYSILVDQTGARFANEAGAYMEIGQRMYRRQRETGKAVPAWVVMDSRQRKYYPWGTAAPGEIPAQWLSSGYMQQGATLLELARKCGIDPAGLASTVERFNGFCRKGVDEDFKRGGRAFDRCHGDPTVKPNPNLGAIEQGPFYAVAIYPGDVGTAGGLLTDESARVLRQDGTAIEGLYATGNATASVVGRCYPGAGASIGASFVFGYLAAQCACAAAQPLRRVA